MKKGLFTIVALVSLLSYIFGAPGINSVSRLDQKGNLNTMDGIGVKYASIRTLSTQTTGATGAGMLYGLAISSKTATTGYVIVADSVTAGATSDVIMTLFPTENGAVETFSPPIRFLYGIKLQTNEPCNVDDGIFYLLDTEK